MVCINVQVIIIAVIIVIIVCIVYVLQLCIVVRKCYYKYNAMTCFSHAMTYFRFNLCQFVSKFWNFDISSLYPLPHTNLNDSNSRF